MVCYLQTLSYTYLFLQTICLKSTGIFHTLWGENNSLHQEKIQLPALQKMVSSQVSLVAPKDLPACDSFANQQRRYV